MSKAKTQASAKYKVVKNRPARIAVKDSQTMAFLHARGLDVEPKGLATALRANGLRYPIPPFGIQSDAGAGLAVSYTNKDKT